MNRPWKRQEITSRPLIFDEPDRSDAKAPYRLDRTEMRTLPATARERPHPFTFCMIALNTLARPDAVSDHSPAQVALDDRSLNRNPPGRRPTRKYRPVVPITDTLPPIVSRRDVSQFVNWHGKPVKSIHKMFATKVERAVLPSEVTPDSLRHTMCTERRRRSGPMWVVQCWLGHKVGGIDKTYARFAPGYLATWLPGARGAGDRRVFR